MRKASLIAALMAVRRGVRGRRDGRRHVGDDLRGVSPDELAGRDTWFKSTFGGEKFFSQILPGPPFNLPLGFDAMLTSDRNTRFDNCGVVNDPDCVQGDASTGYLDKCADDATCSVDDINGASAGIVGVRKFLDHARRQAGRSSACRARRCHAGLDAQNPPANPNHPAWANIHATTGNQYIAGRQDLRRAPVAARSALPGLPHLGAGHRRHHGDRERSHQQPGHHHAVLQPRPAAVLRPDRRRRRRSHVHRARAGRRGRRRLRGGGAARLLQHRHVRGGVHGRPPGQRPRRHADADRPGRVRARLPGLRRRRKTDVVEHVQVHGDDDAAAAGDGAAAARRSSTNDRAGARARQRRCSRRTARRAMDGADRPSDDRDPSGGRRSAPTAAARKTTNWEAGHIWAQFSSDQYKARPTGGPGLLSRRAAPRRVGDGAVLPQQPPRRVQRRSVGGGAHGGVRGRDGRAAEPAVARHPRLGAAHDGDDPVPTPIGPLTLPAGTPVAAFANLESGEPARQPVPGLRREPGPLLRRVAARRRTSTRSPST